MVVAIAATMLIACDNEEDPPYIAGNKIYTINYTFEYEPAKTDFNDPCYIRGNNSQKVNTNENGSAVTAVPGEGYVFVKWSDGVLDATRYESNVHSNINVTAIFEIIKLTVTYYTGEGGKIDGICEQELEYGCDATEVTAVPNDGYLFAGWSDGKMTEKKIDTEVKESLNATAKFIRATKTLRYSYGIPAVIPNTATLSLNKLHDTQFYIPTRDGYIFDGWYLDAELTIKITDGNGYYFRGNTIFYDEGDILYPKWISEKNTTFKLLMVYIEEAHAKLPNEDKVYFDVDYKMDLYERETFKLISERMSNLLNDWFEGSVIFEVDTFFATTPIGTESFCGVQPGNANPGPYPINTQHIYGEAVPELYPIRGDYRSIITSGGMNKNDMSPNFGGSAIDQYAFIHTESLFNTYKTLLDTYFIPNHSNWQVIMEIYLHEFAHTVEKGYNIHDIERYFWYDFGMKGKGVDLLGLYLRNKTVIDGERVGIPIEFWEGNIYINVGYSSSYFGGWDNGKIISEGYDSTHNGIYEYVPFGSKITVEATPFAGFRFVEWSDGVKTPIRTDTNIISRIRVFAIFEKIS